MKSAIGQYYTGGGPSAGYPYYGSPAPGMEPAKKTDWDKFMEFHNSMMPAVSNVLGTWLQGRYQVLSAQEMAKAFASAPAASQQQMMAAYMNQRMLQQQGISTPGMNPMMMNNFGQAMNMVPPQQLQSATQGGMNMLMQGTNNPYLQGLIGQQGAQVSARWPSWALPALLIGGGIAAFMIYQAIAK